MISFMKTMNSSEVVLSTKHGGLRVDIADFIDYLKNREICEQNSQTTGVCETYNYSW